MCRLVRRAEVWREFCYTRNRKRGEEREVEWEWEWEWEWEEFAEERVRRSNGRYRNSAPRSGCPK
jgi:hypothetical protein